MGSAPTALPQGAPISPNALVTASPNPSVTTVGTTVVVTLRVGLTGVQGRSPSGSSTPAVLGGYQIALAFDKTRLQLDSVSGGTSTGYTAVPTFTIPSVANSVGAVTLVASQTSPTEPTGEVTIAFLSFTTLAPGSASLSPTPTSLVSALMPGPPPVGPALMAGTGAPTTVTVNAGAPTPTPTQGPTLEFFSLVPCRVVDTRNSVPAGPGLGKPALVAGATRDFAVGGVACGIPTEAVALVVNLTVTQPTVAGDLRLFAGGTPLPLASAIVYRAGQTRAANTIVALSAGGTFSVRCDQASGTTQFIMDATGYFQ